VADDLYRHGVWARIRFQYRIDAPGGIDVNATMRPGDSVAALVLAAVVLATLRGIAASPSLDTHPEMTLVDGAADPVRAIDPFRSADTSLAPFPSGTRRARLRSTPPAA
jgi:hypothetical protein